MKSITSKVSWAYFLIHLLVELICFFMLFRFFTQNVGLSLMIALVYDIVAFMPQGLIGALSEKYTRLDIGMIGAGLVGVGLACFFIQSSTIFIFGLILVGLGNACIHEAGAISTTYLSEGRLFPSALYVAGGSFGVVIGQTLGKGNMPFYYLYIPLVIIAVLTVLTNKYWLKSERVYPEFKLVKSGCPFIIVVMVAFLVVVVRSFIGYAIPISWKKEIWQAFLLFFVMGIGKGAGGWLSDRFGARIVGVLSSLICIPFLIIGKDQMVISVIGVFLFSMTMSITFGMLLSVMRENPGLAFGVTTVGLALGLLPVFVFGSFSYKLNSILVVSLSIICAIGLALTLKSKKEENK